MDRPRQRRCSAFVDDRAALPFGAPTGLPPWLLGWVRRGPGPWPVLPWLVILLIAPTAQAAGDRSVLRLVVVASEAAAFVGLVFPVGAERVLRRWVGVGLVALQMLLVGTGAVVWGDAWYAVFVLVAISAAVGLRTPNAPVAIVVVATLSSLTIGFDTGDWSTGTVISVNCFLAGAATSFFYWLLAAVGELSRTQAQLAEAAVVRERLRFSRDLHDVLGHTLSVVVVKAEAVRRTARRDPDAAAAHARDIEQIGRSALADVRETVGGYRRTTLAEEAVAARVALRAAGIRPEVAAVPDDLPTDVDLTLGWVVRETTTNVVRHSRAHSCRVGVTEADGRVRLTVVDDGGGASSTAGHGLKGLQERVEQMAGTIEISSAPTGFKVTVDLPALRERADT
ncbi:histidine kinase [Luteipulveratus sp. YIM 133132]|uniref:sensor histidine kinase n=1 Tax=Luteipulveratus flavus TaxID=3031728 RepID=UPI0023B02AC7|nr:histidine kinase [Luteipulveratus sp. YIM 133132]MDE9366174.1 histidine kinase [Luteipulveratus sp. YIM 133132]